MNKPMTVYVIVKGEYSDKHICAVALDKDTAEKLKDAYSDKHFQGKATIEEYTPAVGAETIRVMYSVEFWFGEITVRTAEYVDTEDIWGDEEDMTVYVLAQDQDHALKIAQDRRAEYLARKEGIV